MNHYPLQMDCFPLLSTLDAASLREWQAAAVLVEAAQGSRVVSEGEMNDALYLVARGSVVVQKHYQQRHIEVGRVNAGELFGEWSLLSGQPVGGDVDVLQDAVFYRIPNALVMKQYWRCPTFCHALDRVCERHLVVSGLALNPVFSLLPLGLRQTIFHIGDFVGFEPGAILIAEGDHDVRFMYLLLSGEVESWLHVPGHEDESLLVSCQGVGDMIGEIALISGYPRIVTVRAKSACRALRLSNKDIHSLRLSNLNFSLALYQNTQCNMQRNMEVLSPRLGVEAARGFTVDRVPNFSELQEPEKQIAPLFE
ncbi:MAG: cyclic nucleotide-binding domain-containing protein [Mariprofundales bacterium]|nr:cyclic nucleotide-binding domain-containing protein [Mariprofundales bacterium]